MCDENLKRSSDQSELGNGATKDAKVARMEIIQGVSSIKLTQLAALNGKISILEEKLDTYETTNKELKVALTANKVSFDGLNSKIDKIVRLLSDSTEKQSKMTKELSSLTKMIEKQEEKSRPSPNASMGVFLQNLHTGKQKNAKKPVFEGPEPESLPPPIKRPPVNPLDELKWGQNTYLIGDYIFNTLKEVDDIKEQMKKMESLNFSIYKKNKDKETIGRLFDRSRNQVLFALPNNVQKVIISIGRQDMFDESLLTLKKASLEEVKLKNKSKLKEKAGHIKAMAEKLMMKMNYQVIFIVPATSIQRIEVFSQFEEILQEVLEDLAFPQFKMLNFPELIRSTRTEFQSNEEYLNAWWDDLQKATLSEYGCRRLMEAIKRTVWCKNKSKLNNFHIKVEAVRLLEPDEPVHPCPRCTRLHQGGPDSCRSKNMLCRKCGLIGHFVDVHDIIDGEFRQIIVQTLGVDIYANTSLGDLVQLVS